MPTLENINGASLSQDPNAISSGFSRGFQMGDVMRQRGIEEDERAKQADWDARVDGLSDEAMAGNQKALLNIFKYDPEYAKGIAGVLQSRSVADATKMRNEGNKIGRFAGGLLALGDDTQAQAQMLMKRRNEQIEAGNVGRAEELTNQINMMQTDPNAARFGWQQDIAAAEDADGILKVFSLDDDSDKNKEFFKEERAVATSAVKALKKRASTINSSIGKIKSLIPKIKQGGGAARTAAGAAVMSLARLVSPGVVTEGDFKAMAGAADPMATLMDRMQGREGSGPLLEELQKAYDPTNPNLIDADGLLSIAEALVGAEAPAVLAEYEEAKSRSGRSGMSQRQYNTIYGDDKSITGLSKYVNVPAQDTVSLPQGVTEDDISTTMTANNMTREQVLAKLRGG